MDRQAAVEEHKQSEKLRYSFAKVAIVFTCMAIPLVLQFPASKLEFTELAIVALVFGAGLLRVMAEPRPEPVNKTQTVEYQPELLEVE